MGNIEYGNRRNMGIYENMFIGMLGMWECIEGIYGNMFMECRECGNVLKYGKMFMEYGNVLKYLIFRPIPGRPWVIIITPKSG